MGAIQVRFAQASERYCAASRASLREPVRRGAECDLAERRAHQVSCGHTLDTVAALTSEPQKRGRDSLVRQALVRALHGVAPATLARALGDRDALTPTGSRREIAERGALCLHGVVDARPRASGVVPVGFAPLGTGPRHRLEDGLGRPWKARKKKADLSVRLSFDPPLAPRLRRRKPHNGMKSKSRQPAGAISDPLPHDHHPAPPRSFLVKDVK